MEHHFYILGVDIGGTKIAVSLFSDNGTVIASGRIPNMDREPDDVLHDIAETAKRLLEESGIPGIELKAIGVGSPSPLDFKRGIIMGPPNMKKWQDVHVGEFLTEALKTRVFFDNDANASALAEWIFGSGEGADNMVYVTLSTGIGAGLILNGHLVRGETCDAGEVGHMILDANGPLCNCGLSGCWESFCGGRAIAQRLQKELAGRPSSRVYQIAGSLENIDMKALSQAVREGDPYACHVWDGFLNRNAQAVGMLVNIFNPKVITLGTIAIQCADIFMAPLLERVKQYAWKQPLSACTIVPGRLGGKLGEYAGAAVALYGLYECGEWEIPRS